MIKKADLHEILAKCSGLDVIVVGLGDAAKEVHWVGVAEVVVKGRENISFGGENLFFGEAIIGDVTEVGNVGRENFFILGCDEHCSDTNKLKAFKLDNLGGEESVDDVDGEEESFRQ